ncbi:MAG: hypothetical protein WC975_09875 [Phycisphaerae bacterium]
MTIVFHCEHCGKKVSAPDEAGGKRGKCPRCNQHVFVPLPKDQADEIPLTPVDLAEEERRKKLRQEELKLLQHLQEDQEAPGTPSKDQAHPQGNSYEFAKTEGLTDMVQKYLVHMSRGELEDAEALSKRIVVGGNKSLKTVEQLAMQDSLNPQLAKVPPNVLAGFFKRLLAQFPKQ